MQPTAENVSKLLLTLYAAPMRPELWSVRRQTDLLRLLAELVKGTPT
jgi:hypothetical protein